MSTEIIDLSKVKLADWNIQAMTGYEPKTTFYTDFSIADHFGLVAINDTFKRAFKSWKDNVIYLTELTMVMNWKCFEHYERQNMEFSQKYCALFETLDDYCRTHLKGEDLQYYYRTTD